MRYVSSLPEGASLKSLLGLVSDYSAFFLFRLDLLLVCSKTAPTISGFLIFVTFA